MSIRSFINETKILLDNKKYEEALCLICIAVDVCLAKEYPDKRNRGNATEITCGGIHGYCDK